MKEQFAIFLKELSQALGFNSLSPDQFGVCMIRMKEGDVHLLFEFDDQLVPNTILLSSFICPLPMENRSDIYEEILKRNHMIEETLSCKPDENFLYLHRRMHPEMQAEELKKMLHHFILEVKFWKQKAEEISQQPPKSYRFLNPPGSFQIRV
jgi:hypothetical protein